MEIAEQLRRIRDGLTQGRFANEASVSQGIILPLLNCLDWPVFDTVVVAPEYSVQGRRVDFALCRKEGRPVVFLEAKRVGNVEGGDKQLFEYSYHVGVQLVVLTDGQEWHFYLPAEQGNYNERRVYKLDLLERDIEECQGRLQRYLSFADVCSGRSIEFARKDFQDVSKLRIISEYLPIAWARLIEEQDDIFLELIAEKVEDLSGYKPELEVVSRFLESFKTEMDPGSWTVA